MAIPTDKISEDRIAQLHPKIRGLALEAYREAVRITPVGIRPRITETMRSFARSDELYAQGRTKPGSIVTNARAGQSIHNYGLALDFTIIDLNTGKAVWVVDRNWMLVVGAFKKRGFTWGGDFKTIHDPPHFEMTFGHTWRSLLELHNRKKVDKNGYVLI